MRPPPEAPPHTLISERRFEIDIYLFFCEREIKDKIVTEYYYNEFIGRQDGFFIPLQEWVGHYNIETYEQLVEYFKTRNYEEIWEYSNVIIPYGL